MANDNPIEYLFDELTRIINTFKDKEIPKTGGKLPPDIDQRLLKLRNMIDMLHTSSMDAIKSTGIKKEELTTSIAYPELLTPENKRILNKSKQLKTQALELYKITNRKVQERKPVVKTKAKSRKQKEENVTPSQRAKKFKNFGGSKWKPV